MKFKWQIWILKQFYIIITVYSRTYSFLLRNYRPVTILSGLSEVMEKVINCLVLKYSQNTNYEQYGIWYQWSTGDLLSFGNDIWNKSLKLHGDSQVSQLDIRKGLDKYSVQLSWINCLRINGLSIQCSVFDSVHRRGTYNINFPWLSKLIAN